MPKIHCSGTALKRLACACMLLDHIGASCLEAGLGIPYLPLLSLTHLPMLASDPHTQHLILLNCLLRSIGRLAFPIFAFFLVEGFLHTKRAGNYLLRLALFGLISEPMFDLAFFGTPYYPAHQNIYATLALGLVALLLLREYERNATQKAQPTGKLLLCGGSLLIVVYAANALRTDYGAVGVLLMLAIYLLRHNTKTQRLALVCLTFDQFPAPFAALPLALYDGTRGQCARWEKWAFYAFYPLHLSILAIITNLLL